MASSVNSFQRMNNTISRAILIKQRLERDQRDDTPKATMDEVLDLIITLAAELRDAPR